MLESKLGITDSAELARIEEKISKQKAVEMFESEYFKRKFSICPADIFGSSVTEYRQNATVNF